MPKGPDGLSEGVKPASPTPARLTRSKGIINGRVRLPLPVNFLPILTPHRQ